MPTPDLRPVGTIYGVDRVLDGKRLRVTYQVIDHTLDAQNQLVEVVKRIATTELVNSTQPKERK